METFMKLLETIQTFVWGPPTLVLLMGTGLYFTYKLRGIQICKFPRALKSIFEKEEGAGDVSPFATLCTTLAADIGTGSIVGVATALRIGGPGAMFWMWVSALLGMTTKYAEALLAVKFRVKDEKGEIAGGPMYYIENGMGDKFKWLAKIFAFFGVVTALLGCGTFPQVNAITESVHDSFHIPVIVIGIIVTVLTAVVTLGGAAGTAVVSFMTAMRTGVARGVYTNEAGLGSSPIVAAAAKTDSCVKQGLISMTSVFFTTILTCSMTGLVVISSGLLDKTDLSGSVLVTKAYNAGLPFNIGMYLVAVGIIFFSFTTILGWNYYGERCVLYLTGKTGSIKIFKIVYILAIAAAPFLTLEPIWLMADITNALMIIPNLIALLGLRKVVISETKKFFDREERTKVNVRKSVVE